MPTPATPNPYESPAPDFHKRRKSRIPWLQPWWCWGLLLLGCLASIAADTSFCAMNVGTWGVITGDYSNIPFDPNGFFWWPAFPYLVMFALISIALQVTVLFAGNWIQRIVLVVPLTILLWPVIYNMRYLVGLH